VHLEALVIRRGQPKATDEIGYDEVRECHRPGCGRRFRPTATVSGQSTEYHCSPECAAQCLAQRGRAPVVALEVGE
jgi:hypothetical protein